MPQIHIEQFEHGSIAVLDSEGAEVTELAEAEIGEIVGRPDDGYIFVDYTVDGEVLNSSTFAMPATDVTVSGRLAENEEVEVSLDQVAEAASNTQYFWTDGDGAHVTDMPQDDWVAARDAGFPDISDAKPYANSLWTSLAMLFRTGLNNLVSISRSAIAFFDGEGNAASNIVASFGKDGAMVGKLSDAHMVVSNNYLYLNDSNGSPVFSLVPFGGNVWRAFRVNVGQYPDSNGVIRTSLEPGESALYELDGSFDLSQRPLFVAAFGAGSGKYFEENGTRRVGNLSVTVTAGSSGATVELENIGDSTYPISPTESNPTLISGYSERTRYRIGVEGKDGLTQDVTIGDKTLTITGGIITGIS